MVRGNLSKEFTHPQFDMKTYYASLIGRANKAKVINLQLAQAIEEIKGISPEYLKMILQTRAGNCPEFSYLAFHYIKKNLHKYPKVSTVEYVKGLGHFDHRFILINRKKTDEKEITLLSMDSSTYILDPWLNCHFSILNYRCYYHHIASVYNWGNAQNFKVKIEHGIYRSSGMFFRQIEKIIG